MLTIIVSLLNWLLFIFVKATNQNTTFSVPHEWTTIFMFPFGRPTKTPLSVFHTSGPRSLCFRSDSILVPAEKFRYLK
ncbi:hypothetical protein RB195_004497 [Necator americanus]|uniref:Secreted protein n=1 Tax=Necator americanus TaxID=51031 RepID=A0ABR1BMT3_NECAM